MLGLVVPVTVWKHGKFLEQQVLLLTQKRDRNIFSLKSAVPVQIWRKSSTPEGLFLHLYHWFHKKLSLYWHKILPSLLSPFFFNPFPPKWKWQFGTLNKDRFCLLINHKCNCRNNVDYDHMVKKRKNQNPKNNQCEFRVKMNGVCLIHKCHTRLWLKRQACHPKASSCCYVEQNGYKWVLF